MDEHFRLREFLRVNNVAINTPEDEAMVDKFDKELHDLYCKMVILFPQLRASHFTTAFPTYGNGLRVSIPYPTQSAEPEASSETLPPKRSA